VLIGQREIGAIDFPEYLTRRSDLTPLFLCLAEEIILMLGRLKKLVNFQWIRSRITPPEEIRKDDMIVLSVPFLLVVPFYRY